jgi:hypothetical protein
MSQIAELIDKKDPSWSTTFTQNVAQKLSQLLQKPNSQEMLYSLQRTIL